MATIFAEKVMTVSGTRASHAVFLFGPGASKVGRIAAYMQKAGSNVTSS